MGKIYGGPSVKFQLFEKAGMTFRNMKDAEAIQERLSDPKERAKDLLGYFYPQFKIEYNRLKDLGYISERADENLTEPGRFRSIVPYHFRGENLSMGFYCIPGGFFKGMPGA
jgi:hypothetical protein